MTKIEYYSQDENKPNLARTILTMRDIGKDADYDRFVNDNNRMEPFEMYNIASGWYTRAKENTNTANCEIARRQIYKTEDKIFISGAGGYDGISSTSTLRNSFTAALKEIGPCFVLVNSWEKDREELCILESRYIDEGICYLIPRVGRKVDPSIAELVYSEDIHLSEPWFDGKQGEWFHMMHEWATVEVHKPDAIAKVIMC